MSSGEDSAASADGEAPKHDSALAGLLSRLIRDSETLLLQELALVRAEIAESLVQMATGSALVAVGLALGFAGALGLMAALILVLGLWLPLWLACVIVGGVTLAGGILLALRGRRSLAGASLVPRRALRVLDETGEWLREELT